MTGEGERIRANRGTTTASSTIMHDMATTSMHPSRSAPVTAIVAAGALASSSQP